MRRKCSAANRKDAIGNPTSYYNGTSWTMGWDNGRNLVSASGGGKSITYGYNLSGIRTSKTVGGVTHNYLYASGKLLRETYGSNTLDFFYDADGRPYALKYNGTVYYYITNLQGDVIQLVNASDTVVATYDYDPYGKVISATGTMADINPLRYRGYYYDSDQGMYYLQSRYYDPTICRFINADSYASTGQGIIGHNMFAYCGNNPICYTDYTGKAAANHVDSQRDSYLLLSRMGGGVCVAGIITATLVAASYQSNRETESLVKSDVITLHPGDDGEHIYSVYFLYASGGSKDEIIYVGRVKTANFGLRMRYHESRGRLLSWQVNGLTYAQCRGLEQLGMVYYHSINRSNPQNNQIRGVSPANSARTDYFNSVLELLLMNIDSFEPYIPSSYWANMTENEFLNGIVGS